MQPGSVSGDSMGVRTPPRSTMWRRILPVFCSAGLVAWLFWRIPLGQLVQSARTTAWPIITPITLGVVAVLYLWDSLCVQWIFAQPNGSVRYALALRSRGTAYLAGAVNYSLGQGLLAWMMARALGLSIAEAVVRMAILAFHDLWLLLGFGLIGSLAETDPRLQFSRFACLGGLAILAVLTALLCLPLPKLRQILHRSQWTSWVAWWNWNRSITIVALRLVNFAFSMLYAAVGLYVCNVPWHVQDLFRAIALLQLAEALPITVSGLGARESLLILVINPAQPESVLAFGLMWSAGIIVGRLAIGLANLAISRCTESALAGCPSQQIESLGRLSIPKERVSPGR